MKHKHKHKWIFTGFKEKKSLAEFICYCGLLRDRKVKNKIGCGNHFTEPFDYTCGNEEVNGIPLCPKCKKEGSE